MFESYKQSLKDHTEIKKETIKKLREKCQIIGTTKISKAMSKNDSYVSNMLYKKKSVSDETVLSIVETIEKNGGIFTWITCRIRLKKV